MPVNIKNERVSRLVAELAQKTGESITDAVGKAVEERLKRLEHEKCSVGLAERLRILGEDTARRLPPGFRGRNHDPDLYDEWGLPK